MSLTFRAISAAAVANGGNITPAEPAGAASGDLLVVGIGYRGTVAFTLPAGWAQIELQNTGDLVDSALGIESCLLAYIVRGGSAPSYAFTRTGGDIAIARAVAYQPGAGGVPTLDTHSSNTLTSNSVNGTTGTITTTQANCMLVLIAANARQTTYSSATAATDPTTGWTEQADSNSALAAKVTFGVYDAPKATAGATGTVTMVGAAAGKQAAAVAAFYEAAGVAAGPFGENSQPNPSSSAYPTALRTWVYGNQFLTEPKIELLTMGYDFDLPARVPFPNSLRTYTQNLLETTLSPAAQGPFNQTDWPTPKAPIQQGRGFTQASAFLVEPKIELLTMGKSFALPQAAPYPIALRSWLQNLNETTLAPAQQSPFNQTNWPNPKRPAQFNGIFAAQDLSNTTLSIPFIPPVWPNPKGTIQQARGAVSFFDPGKLAPIDAIPFAFMAWKVPAQTPRPAIGWALNLLETTLAPPGVPFKSQRFPLPLVARPALVIQSPPFNLSLNGIVTPIPPVIVQDCFHLYPSNYKYADLTEAFYTAGILTEAVSAAGDQRSAISKSGSTRSGASKAGSMKPEIPC